MPATDFFGRTAAVYDALRPADANWWDRFDLLVAEADLRGRRVLDVGCGTGTLVAALADCARAKAWGVDASPEMLEVARAKAPSAAGLKVGRAEELPFRDGWFERTTMSLVVHLLDRPRAFGELRRVLGPGGRAAILTFDPAHFGVFWLNRLFPSIERIDRERFPDAATLEEELLGAGFEAVRAVRLDQESELDRETALAKIRGRHISTFDLLEEDELREGLERAERDLPERIRVEARQLVVVAS